MRPNRYPYTKNQWEEETTSIYFGDDTCIKIKAEKIKIISEVRE